MEKNKKFLLEIYKHKIKLGDIEIKKKIRILKNY
jgi:hypothetical protein